MHRVCFQRSGMVHLEFSHFYQALAVFKVLPLRVSTLRRDSERAPPPLLLQRISRSG